MDDKRGMREDRVRDIATRFKAQAQRLDEASADVQKAVTTLRPPVWAGSDATAFQRRGTVLVHEVEAAAQGVRALAAELFAELQAQVGTSAVSDGHGGGPAGPLDGTSEQPGHDIPLDPDLPLRPLDLLWQLLGEDSPWTPQGLAVDAGGGLLMTTMYNAHDTGDGLLVIQDAATGEVLNTVRLDGIDHYGGVAVHGDNVWVSGAGQVQLYSLSEIRAADDGTTATVRDSFPVDGYSTVTYHDGQLWTAQFNGDGPDQIYSYDVSDDGGVAATPSAMMSGEQEMQGIAVNDDYIYVSQSEGRESEHSTLTRIDRATGERESIDVPSNMAEGIALHGNHLVQTYESGAEQYAEGGREPRSTTTVRNVR
ncbi:MAG: hypothetical protein ABIO48_10505 [Pedococcus sp.]